MAEDSTVFATKKELYFTIDVDAPVTVTVKDAAGLGRNAQIADIRCSEGDGSFLHFRHFTNGETLVTADAEDQWIAPEESKFTIPVPIGKISFYTPSVSGTVIKVWVTLYGFDDMTGTTVA